MVSIVCLIITIASYLLSKKLRSSDHGQLLLNLCFALLGLYLSFIVALHSKDTNIFCAFSGAVLQYFFLVTFIVTAAEAIDLYINLVIVLGHKIDHFVLKATLVSWIAPVFVVLFCFSPDYKSYISDPPNFCRAFKAPFYIGVVVPFVLIYLFNWIIFVMIIVSLSRKTLSLKLNNVKTKKESKILKQQLMIAITLSILFGFGWGLGLLVTEDIYTSKTVRDLIASVFVFLTGFHGLFIFVIYCLRSKEVRFVWKNVFLCKKGKEFSTTNFNRIQKTSTGTTTMMSHNLAVSLKKDQTCKFEEGSQMRVHDYTKKNEPREKELNKSEEHINLNCIPNDDAQATLRFYTKKYQDQFNIGETEAISKVDSKSQEPQYSVGNFGNDNKRNDSHEVDEEHF
ncbi:PREDICTED: adhesion G protein-coupled receptor L3-like [Amphimedon queenslandica]|nr:PREDICTED: adhesion G protein-coupled receptor L3-like [Amphimedon queenslandica]|eukprot:XP_019853770.1 PREDICTED: adhesion G protein-coupled receptor L3-like [Amphimedon queenslandica]